MTGLTRRKFLIAVSGAAGSAMHAVPRTRLEAVVRLEAIVAPRLPAFLHLPRFGAEMPTAEVFELRSYEHGIGPSAADLTNNGFRLVFARERGRRVEFLLAFASLEERTQSWEQFPHGADYQVSFYRRSS